MIQNKTKQCSTELYSTVHYSNDTIQCRTMYQCIIKQYNVIQYNTMQYNTTQYSTMQYNRWMPPSRVITTHPQIYCRSVASPYPPHCSLSALLLTPLKGERNTNRPHESLLVCDYFVECLMILQTHLPTDLNRQYERREEMRREEKR